MEKHKEETRDARGVSWLETLVADLRYGARALVKHPGYALLAVLTLGLGIGANTAIFSVINGVLLKPLPYEHGDRLVVVQQSRAAVGPAASRRRDRRVLRLSRARQGRVRRPGRVPPDELRSDQSRRARSRQHRRRVGTTSSTCSASSRSSAAPSSPSDDVRGRRGGAGAQPHLLAHQVRRRSEHRRPGVRDERSAASRDRRAAQRAALSAGERRLHAGARVPVPGRGGEATSRRTAARSAALNVFGRLKPGVDARSRRRARSARSATHFTQDNKPASIEPDTSGFQATTVPVREALTERRARDAADPARHHRPGAADRLRQRRQPHAGADARPRSRAGDARRARRRPRPAGPPAAHREHAAGGRRRRRRRRLRVGHRRHADDVRRPLHVAHRRDRDRSVGAGLHARRVGRHRPAVRHAAGARQPRRSRVGAEAGRRPGRRCQRPQADAGRADRRAGGGVGGAAGRRRPAARQLLPAAAGRDRLSIGRRAVGAGLRQLLALSATSTRCARSTCRCSSGCSRSPA